jgi:chromosome segregation ATPase
MISGLTKMQPSERRLAHEYDPVARREYYLKTRELTGRKKGSGDQLTRLTRSSTIIEKPRQKPKPKTATERRKATEARLEALKGRLEKLQKVLADLVDKTGGGHKKDDSPDSKKRREPSKLTAKQKADAAKRSKEYRKKNPPSEQIKQITAKIKKIQAKIAKLRAEAKIPEKKPQKKSGFRPESIASLPTSK